MPPSNDSRLSANQRMAVAVFWFLSVWLVAYSLYGADILPDETILGARAEDANMCTPDGRDGA